jgi:hypothetical protein
MTAVLIYGFTFGEFGEDGEKILQNPWGIVSLVDLYTGFILFSGWILFREKSVIAAIVWIISMLVLGFFTASLYSLIALFKSNGNWKTFWMGKYANK